MLHCYEMQHQLSYVWLKPQNIFNWKDITQKVSLYQNKKHKSKIEHQHVA